MKRRHRRLGEPGYDYSKLIVPAGIVLIGYTLIKDIGSGIGSIFSKSPEDKAKEAAGQSLVINDAFNPSYYTQFPKVIIPNAQKATDYATLIWNAKGFFKDNESTVIGAVREMPSKAYLSYVSKLFFAKYKRGLIDYIKTFFNSDQLYDLQQIVKSMPNATYGN